MKSHLAGFYGKKAKYIQSSLLVGAYENRIQLVYEP